MVSENRQLATPAVVKRLLKTIGRRMATYSDIDELRDLVGVHADLDRCIIDAIGGLREQGYTWESIGEALGISGKGALMRWRRHLQTSCPEQPEEGTRPPGPPPTR